MALIRNKVKPDGRPYLNPEDELDVASLTEDTIMRQHHFWRCIGSGTDGHDYAGRGH